MNFMYMTFLNEDLRGGYKNKIHSQCKGLTSSGCCGNLIIVSNQGFKLYEYNSKGSEILIKTIKFRHKRRNTQRNAYDEFLIFFQFLSESYKIIKSSQYDFLYIRQIVPITPMLLRFLKKVKKKKIKIFYEYPTYPWKIDMKYVTNAFFYNLDCFFYNSLVKKVDKVVCYGKYEGTNKKFIESMNGINVNNFPLIPIKDKNIDEINFIAVANVLEVHGYDRLIRGLADYYKENTQTKVYFHIVGNVAPRLNLEGMVKQLKLDKYVLFHGYKSGEELDNLYAKMDCAVDTLAYYRRGENCIAGSLKSREYLARGLPFIFSGNLDIAMKYSYDFMIRIPVNPEIIDVKEIVKQFYNIKTDAKDIRKFALDHLHWNKIMKKILIDANVYN